MLYFQQLLLFAFPAYLSCSATIVLPRAQHAAAESEAFFEIHNVMLRAQNRPSARDAPIPRRYGEAVAPIRDTSSESPLAAIKRTLLGTRQRSCDLGYGLCRVSQKCCPDDSRCCDDGGCVTTGQTCCSNGGACDPGYKCCGASNCAPSDSECCSDGRYCYAGLHCVILHGEKGCCEDLRCTGFVSLPSVPDFTYTPISVTPLSFPSSTPLTSPSITLPTPVAPPATEKAYTEKGSYSYYTTTWTWYYYTSFLTTVPPSYTTTTTSTEVTTHLTFSVYATDTADADYQFGSITSAVTLPTAIRATGPTSSDVAAALTATSSSTTAFGAGGTSASTVSSSGVSAAAQSGGVKKDDGFGMLLLSSCLGLGIGLLAVWLL